MDLKTLPNGQSKPKISFFQKWEGGVCNMQLYSKKKNEIKIKNINLSKEKTIFYNKC